MKILPSSSFLLGVILMLSGFSPGLRADEPKAPAAPVKPIEQAKPAAKLINVDFPGGSVAQFVAAVAKSDSGLFTIIGEKEEMEVILPPISLRNIEVTALQNTLRALLTPHGLELTLTGVGISVLYKNNNSNFFRPQIENHSAFESFQLKRFLADNSVDDIVAAIRAGWELDPAHDRNALHLKFHPPTSVLLVSGPSDAIMLTKDILGQIKPSSEKTPVANSKDTPPADVEKK